MYAFPMYVCVCVFSRFVRTSGRKIPAGVNLRVAQHQRRKINEFYFLISHKGSFKLFAKCSYRSCNREKLIISSSGLQMHVYYNDDVLRSEMAYSCGCNRDNRKAQCDVNFVKIVLYFFYVWKCHSIIIANKLLFFSKAAKVILSI